MSSQAGKERTSDEALNEKSIVVDTLQTVRPNEVDRDTRPPMSRKETLSAYFTIAAAAFGLIRYVRWFVVYCASHSISSVMGVGVLRRICYRVTDFIL